MWFLRSQDSSVLFLSAIADFLGVAALHLHDRHPSHSNMPSALSR